ARQRIVVGEQQVEGAEQVQRVVLVRHLPEQGHRRCLFTGCGRGGGVGGRTGPGLHDRSRRLGRATTEGEGRDEGDGQQRPGDDATGSAHGNPFWWSGAGGFRVRLLARGDR